MSVSLVCCVRGPIFERYWDGLLPGASKFFRPAEEVQIVKLPCNTGWPWASTSRYQVILNHLPEIHGDYIFHIDADMQIEAPVGPEILADGMTVTTHPGFPPGSLRSDLPYETNPESRAYVAPHEGERYYPGAFEGGTRPAFLRWCYWMTAASAEDHLRGIEPVWNDESYLNRYLIDHPPALVLDERYCYWDSWGPSDRRIIVHLDKTKEEFAERGK